MGLDIGIDVKAQETGYERPGRNPTSRSDAAEQFGEWMGERFPGALSTDVAIQTDLGTHKGDWWSFSCRVYGYGEQLRDQGKTVDDVFAAIYAYVLTQFSVTDGILSEAWHAP